MGKGDVRTKRGKTYRGNHGNTRPANLKRALAAKREQAEGKRQAS